MDTSTHRNGTYFPYPYTLDPLPHAYHTAMIPIAVFGVLSFSSTICLLAFMTYRMVYSSKFYKTPLLLNQPIMLIYQLLLADALQGLAFSINFHWVIHDYILAPTSTCSAQGFFLQIGDVSSGLFSLMIALQTFAALYKRIFVTQKVFVVSVLAVWALCLLLSVVGPIMHKQDFFVRAEAWCWISAQYDNERLALHYIWIFTCEFGNLVLYALLFLKLNSQLRKNADAGVTSRTVHRVARLMLIYPLAYTIITLPLAAARMASVSGHNPSLTYYSVAGSLFASSGWIDCLLYMITRRAILFDTNLTRSTELAEMAYGTLTTARAVHKKDNANVSNSSQENIVKMEQAVEITVEQRSDGDSVHGPPSSADGSGSKQHENYGW